jgi:imidazolonepropionase-like amidohydrolase
MAGKTEARWVVVDRLVDGTAAAPSSNVAIGIAGDRIAAIVNAAQLGPDDRVDAHYSDCTMIPGLVDAHVHLTFSHETTHRETEDEAIDASADELTLRATRNAQKCLGAGVTTVRDCGEPDFVTLALRDAIDRGWVAGPRILAAGRPVTTTGGHLHWAGIEADDRVEIRKAIRALGGRGVDHIKVMATGGDMTATSNPMVPQYTVEELAEVVGEAERFRLKVAAHVLSTEGIRRCVDAGVHSLEHCAWRSPSGDGVELELVKRIVESGTWVTVTLSGIMRRLLPGVDMAGATHGDGSTDLMTALEYARVVNDMGAPWLIASDAGTRFTRFEDFHLSLRCAVEGIGLTPTEAIHRATLVPAELLGQDMDIGSVTTDKRADLVIVEGDVDQDITAVQRVVAVWQGGQLVAQDGMLAGPHEIPARIPPTASS